MKRNLFKTKMAVVMSVVLMLMPVSVNAAATTVTAPVAAGTTTTGVSTLVSPIYKVTLPTAIVLAFDPMDISGKGSILAGTYGIGNLSNVPVMVDVEIKTTVKAGTAAAPAPTFVTYTSAGVLTSENIQPGTTTRSLDLAFVSATKDQVEGKFTGNGATTAFTGISDASFDVEETAPVVQDMKLSTDTAIKATYVLAKANYTVAATGVQTLSSAASAEAGVAAFTLKGSLNPYATWAAGDVSVVANYKISGLPSAAAVALISDSAVYPSSHNMVTGAGL